MLTYWKPLAALALLAFASCSGWVARGWKDKAERLESVQRDFERIAESDRAAAKADVALQKALREQPKAGPKVREAVRANPTDCRVPAPVADSLRDAIERANEAAR